MAYPAWTLATMVSGDALYLEYATSETHDVIDYLQNPKTGPMFSDSRCFDRCTENSQKVFWSRGNGWGFADLARFIEAMPKDHPEQPLMVSNFKTVADTLVTIQREDGYWSTSLMGAELLTDPETSGMAFFDFGMAWGFNNGLLRGKEHETARGQARDAMRAATSDSGKVCWVQQIGKDPQSTDAGKSQLYTVGRMLQFASEMNSTWTYFMPPANGGFGDDCVEKGG